MDKLFINPEQKDWSAILQRPVFDSKVLEETVSTILDDVKLNGDVAIKKYAAQFDKVELDELRVNEAEIAEAFNLVNDELKAAISHAKNNIEKFHLAQVRQEGQIETSPGVFCWRKSVAIQKVGLYIPGGSAPLFLSLIHI